MGDGESTYSGSRTSRAVWYAAQGTASCLAWLRTLITIQLPCSLYFVAPLQGSVHLGVFCLGPLGFLLQSRGERRLVLFISH